MKTLLALASLSLMGATTPPNAYNNGFFIPLDLVQRITCTDSTGGVTGTGSFIDDTVVLTAAHVTHGRTCEVGGRPATLVYENVSQDIAVLRTRDKAPSRISVSCAKPKAGDEAFAVGFVRGQAFVVQRYTATGSFVPRWDGMFKGLYLYKGMSYHGMSGGPVFDRDGSMIGILNAGNDSGVMMSRLLSGTYICGFAA